MPARAINDQADYLIIALLPMDHPDYNAELFRVSMPGHTADGFMQTPPVPEQRGAGCSFIWLRFTEHLGPVVNAITGAISYTPIATEPTEVSCMI